LLFDITTRIDCLRQKDGLRTASAHIKTFKEQTQNRQLFRLT